jgi:hypothetical protein
MRVRVKADARVMAVTAFGGSQYIRSEWRDVPEGCELEALRHPYLEFEPVETEADAGLEDEPVEAEPEPAQPVKRSKK